MNEIVDGFSPTPLDFHNLGGTACILAFSMRERERVEIGNDDYILKVFTVYAVFLISQSRQLKSAQKSNQTIKPLQKWHLLSLVLTSRFMKIPAEHPWPLCTL